MSPRNAKSALYMDSGLVITALGVLAKDTRLAVFRMLVEQEADGLSAGVITNHVRVPTSSLTFRLQPLLHAGLVTQRRESRQLIYAADHAFMNDLVACLTENCCGQGATPQKCNPAAMAKPAGADVAA